jgi:signal transduction histidine kinase/CheY-like chemotaxis protein
MTSAESQQSGSDMMRRVAQWVSQMTGMPALLFVQQDDSTLETVTDADPIRHPILLRFAADPDAMREICRKPLRRAASEALLRGEPVVANSSLGEGTVWACPAGCDEQGHPLALAAYLHSVEQVADAEILAQNFGVSAPLAQQAVEDAVAVCLTAAQVEALRRAILVGLTGTMEVTDAHSGDGRGRERALPDLRDADVSTFAALLGTAAGAPSIVEAMGGIVEVLAHRLHLPVARAWLLTPGPAGTGRHVGEGREADEAYLETVAAYPDRTREGPRVVLSELPEELRRPGGVVQRKVSSDCSTDPLWYWIAGTGARQGALCAVGGPEWLGIIGLGIDGRGRGLTSRRVHALCRAASDILAGARAHELEHENVRRLRELSVRLASNNQKLRDEIRAAGLLMASMSHELRTPLNGIIGLTELLRDGAFGTVTPQQGDYLATVERSGRHLVKLIDDLLDIASIETGRFSLRPEPTVISQVLAEAAQNLQPMALARRVRVVLSLPPDDVVAVTDPERLRQIVVNLLSNALKFSPPGEDVHVSGEVDGDHITLRVKDNGPGVATEERDAIFEQFRKGTAGMTSTEEGQGLGLPLVKRLVEVQGGSVEVISTEGEGAEFVVILPAVVSSSEAPPAPEESTPPPEMPHPMPAASVLVIEADAPSRLVLMETVANTGFSPVGYANSHDIVRIVRELQPVVIILGQAQGGHTVDEGLAALRNDPIAAAYPVLFVGDRSLRERALQVGVSETCQYPVNRTEIARLLRRLARSGHRGEPRLALVMDDNPGFADAMAILLETVGWHAVVATDGLEGVEMARRYLPDVVLLDLMLPRANGWDVLDALADDVRTREIPVAVMTVKPLTDDERTELETRTEGVLSKATFSPDALWGLLERLRLRSVEGGADYVR